MPEAESELVAGYMTEYSGFRWALYFLAEYTNMIVVASIATTLFLGGWLRPFAGSNWANFFDYIPMLLMLLVAGYCLYRAPKQPVPVQKMFMIAVAGLCFVLAVALAAPIFAPAGSIIAAAKPGIHGAFWFLLKVAIYLYVFLWLRFTFPRYRFDQLMALGWHFLIPVSIVNVFGVGVAIYLHRPVEEGGRGWPYAPAIVVMLVITLLIAGWLAKRNESHEAAAAVGDNS